MKTTYILLALLSLGVPVAAQATTIAYVDDDTLFTLADIVVDAKVWRWQLSSPSMAETTDYEVEALECFKGCQKGQFFTMSSPGISTKREALGVHETVAGAPHPEKGDRVIVYLRHDEATGLNHILGLGLGLFNVRYHPGLKRFIAHRETESLFLMKPTSKVARDADNQVLVSNDRLASDVIEKLRVKAKGR